MTDFVLDIGDWGEDTRLEKVVVGEDWTHIKFERCERMAIIASTPNTSFFASAVQEEPGSVGGLTFMLDTQGIAGGVPTVIRFTRRGRTPPIYIRGSAPGDIISVVRTFPE